MVGRTKPDSLARGEVKEYSETMAFATSFVTLMFLGFVMGYYVGQYLFQWPDTWCYFMSIGCGIVTIILETVLYIIKIEKKRMTKVTKVKPIPAKAPGKAKTKLD